MRCTIESCLNDQNKRKDMSFHKFPEIEIKRDRWLLALNLAPENINPRSVVCSDHFHDDDYLVDDASGRRRLKPSAVPFLVDDHLSSSENEDFAVEDYNDPMKSQIISETRALEITVLKVKSPSSPDDFSVERRTTMSTKPDQCDDVDEDKAIILQRLNELESNVSILQQTVQAKNGMIKLLRSKMKSKGKKMRRLLTKCAQLEIQNNLLKKQEKRLEEIIASATSKCDKAL